MNKKSYKNISEKLKNVPRIVPIILLAIFLGIYIYDQNKEKKEKK